MALQDAIIVRLCWGSFLLLAVANGLVLVEALGKHHLQIGTLFVLALPVALVAYLSAVLLALFSDELKNDTVLSLALPLVQIPFTLHCLGYAVRNNALSVVN